MSNYTTEYIKHKLTTTIDKISGDFIKQDIFIEKKKTLYKANTRGMQKMKKYDYCNMQEEVISSNIDLKLWNKLVFTYQKDGFSKQKNGVPLGVNDIAKEFNVTRQKVSEFIRKCKKANFVQVDKRIIFLNPFVLTPYGIKDQDLYELQKNWEKRTKN